MTNLKIESQPPRIGFFHCDLNMWFTIFVSQRSDCFIQTRIQWKISQKSCISSFYRRNSRCKSNTPVHSAPSALQNCFISIANCTTSYFQTIRFFLILSLIQLITIYNHFKWLSNTVLGQQESKDKRCNNVRHWNLL